MAEFAVVGKSVYRKDARQKVRGEALHVGNIEMPGMLHVAVLRSPYPHARIVAIDRSRAERLSGVAAVLTGADIARMPGVDPYFGPAFRDQPILAVDKACYAGDPVVAVAACDRRTAEDALSAVEVEYEPLPAVLDVLEAVKPESPLVHERHRPAKAFADLAHVKEGQRSNICYHFKLRRGDVERAFAEADRVFEDTYSSPPAQHVPMEPHVTLAYLDEARRLNVWSATQTPSYVRTELSQTFGIPMNRVRVRVPYLGGGYGSKLYAKLEPLVTAFALVTRRPVRYALTREEEFLTITKHRVIARVKTAVKNGRITARKCEVFWDTGAYAEIGPRVVHKSGYTSAGPYRIPNVWIDSYCVYTNHVPAGAFRGFGVPQVIWAYDSQMDSIARAIGADPVEFRLQHALEEGEEFATGTPVRSFGIKQAIREAARAVDWSAPRPAPAGTKRRGKGVAAGVKAVLTPSISGAIVILNADGSVSVLSSTVEMGQGAETMMGQIVAEELGVSFDQVHVVQPDTDVTPYDTITAGSRSTYHMGNAVRMAAAKVKAQLFEVVARKLEVHPEDLVASGGRIFVRGSEARGMTIPEAFLAKFGSLGTTLTGEAICQPEAIPTDPETGQSEKCTEYWFPSATSAEVEVDIETGRVRLLQFYSVGDTGTAIHPRHCEQQLLGSAITHLGLTLFEEMVFQDGQLVNGSLLDYQVASIRDLPEVFRPVIVEVPHETGPFGAKGVGETGTLTVSAAIANAIEDAIGVRIRDLPITPEKVLRALAAKQGAAGGLAP
ncbi:MAG TPA: xanthine dehydrogenase family protein molybdopterin-binding subunit [candidate division Zixibacteria bacterium]|nr:xanthine dehydrogenase family protein molybdopterin-binding subunit [candidate division Zixibacteria bacterium]